MLAQEDDNNKERAIYYLSRTLISYEMNYSIIEKACLAVVFVSQKLRHYMLAHTTRLVAKIDPLKYLLSKAALTGRLAKWVMVLSEFDIQYVERKAIKGQVIADQLAEAPMQSSLPLNIDFPDESILTLTRKTWVMFFDGSFTQQGSGAGILFITPQRYSLPKAYKILFPCTNNIAEYEALINGMKIAAEWGVDQLNVFGDSQLIINQVNDIYQTKDEKLLPYKCMVDDMKQYFSHITFQQVPRADNKATDAMETLA